MQPCGVRKYQIDHEGITESELAALRTHFNLAKFKVNDFSFYNRQSNTTLSGFHYESFKIGKHRKRWARIVSTVLVRFE